MSSWLDSLWQDVRFAGRLLAKSPSFFAAAALTLALGIGANTAMFGVVYGVLLKPLPYDEPDRLVAVWGTAPGIGWKRAWVAAAQYFTYREENRVFEDVAAWNAPRVTVTGQGDPEPVRSLTVTDGFLPVLRVTPVLGRRFTREDDSPASAGRVMLSYGFWQQRFGGDPGVIGRTLIVDGAAQEIIGVLPRGFSFMDVHPQVVLPLKFDRAATQIRNFGFIGLARLKPGVTIEQANRDVGRMIPLTAEKFPFFPGLGPSWYHDAKFGPNVYPLDDDARDGVGRVLWVLMGTIGLVLLIACANVANLFLVRADGRGQELAIRGALGAGRARIARTLLSESLMIAIAGGVAGIALAQALIRVVRATAPDALPRVDEIALHPLVLLFAGALSLAAGFLFGLIPVLKFASPRLSALKDGGRYASDGRDRHRARSALVVSEIAMALVLVVGAALMIRTFIALRQVDPGFSRAGQLLAFDVSLSKSTAADPDLAARRHADIVRSIQQVPGVESVALTSCVALERGRCNAEAFLVEDFPRPEGQAVQARGIKWISPGYFETQGTRVIAGRTPTWADVFGVVPVVLINERLAREYWRTPAEAIGKRVRESAKSPWREIVGVVANERQDGLAQEAPPLMYWPYSVDGWYTPGRHTRAQLTCIVRSPRTGSPTLLAEVARAVHSVDRDIPLSRVRTFDGIVAESMSQTSFALVLLAIAGAVSLLLGIVGIYGVTSYIAAQRTREVGIRLALGAQTRDVTRLFVRHGLRLAALGVAVGVLAALALSRLMTSLLFNVTSTDPLTYAAVSAGLAVVAVVAGYLPARRAARLDPVVALRAER